MQDPNDVPVVAVEVKADVDPAGALETLLLDRRYRTGHFGKRHLGAQTDLRCYRDQASAGQERDGWDEVNRSEGTASSPSRQYST